MLSASLDQFGTNVSITPFAFREEHLRRILKSYASYYNRVLTHLSLDNDAPLLRHRQTVGTIAAIPVMSGPHHQYVRFSFW